MPNDGLARRPNDVGLLQLFATGVGHHREFWRKALHMFSFFLDEALRDEQRKIRILMPRRLELIVQRPLNFFPYGKSMRLDDHGTAHNFSSFSEAGLANDVLVP